ncbi:MAG: hypothetical protein P4L28_03470 [Paludibacteraceae bacterium]|nr:hypothetical protein [Paludibacteraceae bacterium]
MPKEDYLLKFIEKLNRVITAMMGFREKGFPEDALRLADEAYTELLSLDLLSLQSMTEAEFQSLLETYNLNVSYLGYLAEILYQTGDTYSQLSDKGKATNFYQKSLQTLLFQIGKDKTFSLEREAKISELKKRIQA